MRVIRAFVDAPLAIGARIALPEDVAGHLVRVLRLVAGDSCLLFNGDGRDYAARIVSISKKSAEAEIESMREVRNESPLRIVLVQGIARGEKMDLVLQKATELGIAGIVPVHGERGEVRLDGERAGKRLRHWRSVVTSACEQSGRACIPDVAAPRALADALAGLPKTRLLLDPEATQPLPSSIIDNACALAIGPEGGWSPADIATLEAAGFIGARLGPRVLRTETAGLAAIAALQARAGDLA
ncbi:MAG TPA: 16S rRNA (uracil(1498)-N(3))-methyltransferase [Lysobacter sp.]|nr:16S rRNA (uracil(1498)-N(3))-methyltransferase [Lysobacter sp.]